MAPSRVSHGLAFALAALLAGCSEPERDLQQPPLDAESPPDSPQEVKLLDMEWNFTNRYPHAFNDPVEVARFEVSQNMTYLQVLVELLDAPQGVFAKNAEVRRPNGESEFEAFNLGVAVFEYANPSSGEWRIGYSSDEIYPMGQNRLHVVVNATVE